MDVRESDPRRDPISLRGLRETSLAAVILSEVMNNTHAPETALPKP